MTPAAGPSTSELVDPRSLEQYLDTLGFGAGHIDLCPIGNGHSNPTFLLRRGDRAAVLRRPPMGSLAPRTHDMQREARIIGALAPWSRVPQILASCDDPDVIGAPFYLMSLMPGEVVDRGLPPELDSPGGRISVGAQLVETLVELHALDVSTGPLDALGRPDGYVERQLRTFEQLWDTYQTREVAAIPAVATWLHRKMPTARRSAVVHGDFRLGNVLFSDARLTAVLDWEMATVGDPMADLGYLAALWVEPTDPHIQMFELSPVTRQPGFASREELVEYYASLSSIPVDNVHWFHVLALWKLAILMEGNYRRALEGESSDGFNRGFGTGVLELAERAQQMTRPGHS